VVVGLVILLVGAGPKGAQPARGPQRIAVLHDGFFAGIPGVSGLKDELRALGLEDGRDVSLDIQFTRGSLDAIPALVTTATRSSPTLIFTINSEPITRAAKDATQSIPIVFVAVGDPVAAGLVASISHPGGNVTGVSSLATELVPKRLEVLKAIAPGVRRVWAVYPGREVARWRMEM
jgi:ABC-type uncharacterized transport system substrate-binding protein